MTSTQASSLLQWFARCGDRYVDAYLSCIDKHRLAVDRQYGLKLFLFIWAFERAGAPRAYRVAAVKAVSSLGGSRDNLAALFGKFCAGKHNPSNNPVVDARISNLDIPQIVKLVRAGALHQAFAKLELKGVGHKLRAFFLRDLVTLLNVESTLHGDPGVYLWCQPIDVWVRMAVTELCRTGTIPRVRGQSRRYKLSPDDLAAAQGIVQLSIEAGVSPLRVNQGIWYFSANVVADEARLRSLLRSGDAQLLEGELALMQGFLPARPAWGAA